MSASVSKNQCVVLSNFTFFPGLRPFDVTAALRGTCVYNIDANGAYTLGGGGYKYQDNTVSHELRPHLVITIRAENIFHHSLLRIQFKF